MDKREQMIEALEMSYRYSNVDEENTLVPQQLVLDVLALLKAQEPLEPIIVNGEPECAECLYELRSDADSYCPCCGRKVKWE